MHYNKKTVEDIDVSGKKVLLRCDFNVPRDKYTGRITDPGRVIAALPTIRYLLDHGAAVIACSHLGRPKGVWKPELSMAPVGEKSCCSRTFGSILKRRPMTPCSHVNSPPWRTSS